MTGTSRAILAVVPAVSILVVDDNSPDGTATIVKALQAQIPSLRLLLREKKQGLGQAYIAGFNEVMRLDPVARSIVMMDADFSHDPTHLPGLLQAAEQYELVVGSRYIPGGGAEGLEGLRLALSQGGNFYARLITGMPVHDSTTGFNVLRVDLLKRVLSRGLDLASGYAFQIELKYLMWKAGASVKEFPIHFKLRHAGKSKMSGSIVLEGALAPWRLRLRHK